MSGYAQQPGKDSFARRNSTVEGKLMAKIEAYKTSTSTEVL
jgi:hypothetical protein